jgi:3-phosphoshikimate 1-carboxyvinyltransferase
MIPYLDIAPFVRECDATIRVPGSKSISNRALILAALCRGKVTLEGMLKSEDVDLMLEALESLGLRVERTDDGRTVVIEGCGGELPAKNSEIFVGNAGTVARFLTALLAIQKDAVYELDGSAAMRERPMGELLSFLENNGASCAFGNLDGCFPFQLSASGLGEQHAQIDATKSSQVLSAILMIAPAINNKYTLKYDGGTVSAPFVDITLSMMDSFSPLGSFSSCFSSDYIEIESRGYRTDDFHFMVEPDATAASYFLTLPVAVGGKCELDGIHDEMLQGDSAYLEILKQIGVQISKTKCGIESSMMSSANGGTFDFNDISDTFLSLAAVSPLLSSPLIINGISHTRKQETDRVSAMASELRKLGQSVDETEDQLHIIPNLDRLKDLAVNGLEIDTYKDHRFAMSFGILGCHDLLGNGEPWLRINDPNCCAKTFPAFFQKLQYVRDLSHS